jgi:guanylate kinase
MAGKFVVLVGLPGTGKDTVRRAFQREHPEYLSVKTYTTRPQRPGEIDEIHDIVPEAEFKKLIAENKLIEYVHFAVHYYGTPLAVFKNSLEEAAGGGQRLQILDPEGAAKLGSRVEEFYRDAPALCQKILDSLVIVLIDIPPEEAARRAALRGTSGAEIDERVARDSAIIAAHPEVFKYRLINKEGDIAGSVKQLEAIIAAGALPKQ